MTQGTEDSFTGSRGRQIFWRGHEPNGAAHAVVAISHGFGEHGGRYGAVADHLTDSGHAVFALDHHGHGRSRGRRALIRLDDAVADLDRLVDLAGRRHPGLPRFLLGHSMGGAIALRYALIHQAKLTGLILSAALTQVEDRPAMRALGKLLGAVAPVLPVAKVDPGLVSRDPDVVEAYRQDPLVHHGAVPAGTAAELIRHGERIAADAARITLPTLLLWGTRDGLCPPTGSALLAQRLGAEDLTAHAFSGLYHEILNEPERDVVLGHLDGWLAVHAATASAGSGGA